MQVDYLIVGQGLAGTILADHLMQAGQSIAIINENIPHSSSKVAAGIYNPITGKKMNKTWMADQLFPYLIDYYSSLERRLHAIFMYKDEVYRPFLNQMEQNDWISRSSDERYMKYIKKVHTQPLFANEIINDFGGIELESSGYIRVIELLSSFEKLLNSKGLLFNEKFYSDQLVIKSDGIQYKEIQAKKLIICNGFDRDCKYFAWLPFRPVKGEIIEIQTNVTIKKIVNRGVFILPLGDGRYNVGATYEWKDLSTTPTEKAKLELEEKLKKLLKSPFEVVGQRAGVRPSTLDRRPFIGMHPEFKQIGIFGGLGTKGVSLAPYFSQQFVNFLVNSMELTSDVNVTRFKSLYYGKF